jgi:hypothetical protein
LTARQDDAPAATREEAPMMTTPLFAIALIAFLLLAHAAREVESVGTAPTGPSAHAPVIDEPAEASVGDRYLVPNLPAHVVKQLPLAEAKGDRYLAERIALAELVIGERIPAAERQAASYPHDLPGFTAVLLSDGFRQDANGAWYYDRFASWMRFPLHR